MSDEELSITKAAAELSSHFLGCMPHPEKSNGGLVDTKTELRHFPTEESFDNAMRQHAFEGLEEAELAEHGLPIDEDEKSPRQKKVAKKAAAKKKAKQAKDPSEKSKSSYARKKEKRISAAKEAERAAFMAEARRNAQRVVAELRAQAERQKEIDAAVALAATPEETPPTDLPAVSDERRGLRTTISNLTDPDRMHHRFRSFGIHP